MWAYLLHANGCVQQTHCSVQCTSWQSKSVLNTSQPVHYIAAICSILTMNISRNMFLFSIPCKYSIMLLLYSETYRNSSGNVCASVFNVSMPGAFAVYKISFLISYVYILWQQPSGVWHLSSNLVLLSTCWWSVTLFSIHMYVSVPNHKPWLSFNCSGGTLQWHTLLSIRTKRSLWLLHISCHRRCTSLYTSRQILIK